MAPRRATRLDSADTTPWGFNNLVRLVHQQARFALVPEGGPPVLLGAMSKWAAKHIAEYCDGWFPVDGPYDLAGGIEALRVEAARVRRSMDEFDLSVITAYALAGVSGSESRVRELLHIGFKRILFLIEPGAPDAQWPVLERYAGLMRSLR